MSELDDVRPEPYAPEALELETSPRPSASPSPPPAPAPRRVPAWATIPAYLGAILASLAASVAVGVVALVGVIVVRGMPPLDQIEVLGADPFVMIPSAAAGQLGLLFIALATPLVFRAPLRDALGLSRAPLAAFLVAPLGALGLGPFANLLVEGLLYVAPNASLGLLEQLSELVANAPILALLPVVALLPGFCEELLFRGLIQRSLGNGVAAVLVSSVLFSTMHIDPPHVIAVLPMALYLGFIALRTRSVWVGVFAHIVNNAASIVASRIAAFDVGEGSDVPMPFWWIPVGLSFTALAVGVILWSTRRERARAREVQS